MRTVAVVGAGAIGASWAALALHQGYDVIAADPAASAEITLRATVDRQLRELQRIHGENMCGQLTFTTDIESAAARADLVLEGGPERLDVKRELFARLDSAADADVLLCSSSSGLPPSSFQDACTEHPERVLVTHPFNPPHLMPLVEVVGGRQTSDAAVEAAMTVMRSLDKQPIRLRRELPGHVANRLQAALWREAYSLVDSGALSLADIDTAISAGPGLRWALLGPFVTQHLSGGPGGIEHVLEHLGPPMVEWWDDLGHPQLSPELVAAIVDGVDAELAGVDTEQLVTRRDAALSDLLALKARHHLIDLQPTPEGNDA
ncbi:3-hydroxyacyl-CoA dehydrogenase NAD-binding domain-containing protein [Rudaeicoccus suwonensis]|uniref:3-hydroxyacyl-CoA dehydrogenase n=1 Tax=Rudaeicoccus suwonensis TaxID=657409 RepID=A0A561E361_9MICO|nr:3-hydroxyacyl-CoA dehydrogenase NAD-binding domain-containing protein [Rudaeicoccus suwonensis]TWE10054.1 3-hydroxyacyl-CoA dehydrogenase [Rudaeicoccus suwonensis]